MTLYRPTDLGVIACPGGRRFAQEVIHHLKRLYQRRWEKKITSLAEQYQISQEEVIRQANFDVDLHASAEATSGATNSYRVPRFVVPAQFTRFANGEFKTEILSSVRGMDLYIVQDVENHYPVKHHGSDEGVVCSVNDHIFTLFTTIDAAKQAGAAHITVVLPSYPYARQHKKKGREGLTAARVAMILEMMGVDRIISLDIHSKEIENAFRRTNLENLHASYQILRTMSGLIDLKDPEIVVVSPDTGAVDRNKFYASSLKRPLALLYKERDYSKLSQNAGESNITSTRLLGDVAGKTVIMADDMLGTGGTMIKAFKLLKDMGAKKILSAVSLPMFTGDAIKYFDKAYEEGLFYRIIGTNAVYHEEALLGRPWYTQAGVSDFFARAISRLHHNRSLSSLLDNVAIIQKLLNQ